MSSMMPHVLKCPSCSNSQETTVWQSLNVTLDPDLKVKLLEEHDINIFTCQKCAKKTFINAPLLYHDMTQSLCVQYYPPGALDDEAFYRQFKPDGSLPGRPVPAALVATTAYLTTPHIVFDMDEMVRYITFRDRLLQVVAEPTNLPATDPG